MKAAMRKRYDAVKATLEKANKDMATGEYGIMGIDSLRQAESAAGKLIFDMVIYEEGSDQDLQQLISHRVLLQTIFATLDHRAAIMSRVNQDKSRAPMRLRIELLYAWLDQNISRYPKRLEDCAEDAVEQIDGLGMTAGTVKKHITAYRRQKGLAASKSENNSKKKTKVAS
jgi:hypothetical protein